MNVVPRLRTPVTSGLASVLLRSTFEAILARTPTTNEQGSLLSLIWIETGAGQSVNNHNFGNITAASSFAGNVWRPPWFELTEASTDRDRELHRLMLEGKAPSAFRAYPSPEAGMIDFINQIRRSFPEVLAASNTGDPDAFRRALAIKYSRDYSNPESTKTFTSLFRQFGLDPKAEAGAAETYSKPSLTSELPTLRLGSSGNAVSLLGAFFGWEGEAFGANLEARVKSYQGARSLVPDGVVGRKTWASIIHRLYSRDLDGTA